MALELLWGPQSAFFERIFDTFLEHVFQDAPKPVFGRILHRFSCFFSILFLTILTIDAQVKNIDFGCYLLYFGYIGPSGARPKNDDKTDLKKGSTLDSKSEKYVPKWVSKWGRVSPGKSMIF